MKKKKNSAIIRVPELLNSNRVIVGFKKRIASKLQLVINFWTN